jgi:hypothetical protein
MTINEISVHNMQMEDISVDKMTNTQMIVDKNLVDLMPIDIMKFCQIKAGVFNLSFL